MKRTLEEQAFLDDAIERYRKSLEKFDNLTDEEKNEYYLADLLRMSKEIESSGKVLLTDKELAEALEDIKNSTNGEDYVSKFKERQLKRKGAEE